MSVTEIEQRCNALRNDLKIWEKTFAAQNGGRKAGRDDIKANEDICTHADLAVLSSSRLTHYSQQIQGVQQATRQASGSGSPADPLETSYKPKNNPRC